MKASEIVKLIEEAAPLDLAYPWDNSGFLCGDMNKEVNKVYLTLDINMYTVNEAAEAGADMIIAHHPLMFNGIKKINYNTPQGYVLKTLIEKNIAVYAAHTSMDCAENGINKALAQKLGLKNTDIVEKNEKYPHCGLGRIGTIEKMSLSDFARKVKECLNTPFVRVCGDLSTEITTVAVGSGACDDLIPLALEMGADVLVTADMKYHISMDAVESGLCIIDAGHFPTEVFVTDIFKQIIQGRNLEIVKSTETDVFSII